MWSEPALSKQFKFYMAVKYKYSIITVAAHSTNAERSKDNEIKKNRKFKNELRQREMELTKLKENMLSTEEKLNKANEKIIQLQQTLRDEVNTRVMIGLKDKVHEVNVRLQDVQVQNQRFK